MGRPVVFESFGEAESRAKRRERAAKAAAQAAAEAAKIEKEKPTPPEETELYRMGFEAGREEAEAECEARRRETEAARQELAKALASLKADRAAVEADIAARSGSLVRQVSAAIAPRLAARGFAEEASARVRDWLARAARGQVMLRVSPNRVEQLSVELPNQQSPEGAVEIIEDASMSANALRLEWTDGLAEVDLDRVVEEVMAALDAVAPETVAAAGEVEQAEELSHVE